MSEVTCNRAVSKLTVLRYCGLCPRVEICFKIVSFLIHQLTQFLLSVNILAKAVAQLPLPIIPNFISCYVEWLCLLWKQNSERTGQGKIIPTRVFPRRSELLPGWHLFYCTPWLQL